MDEKTMEKMIELDLMKFWKAGSNNYPNIIGAYLNGKTLIVTYLQLDGFTKTVQYLD